MANLLDIRRRIKSVKNTQQITKAMKMVSAARLRRAQERAISARPFATKMAEVLTDLASHAGEDFHHPLLDQRGNERYLLVLVTADKGLAGAFNANLIKAAQSFMREHAGQTVELLAVGRKGRDFFRRRPVEIVGEYIGLTGKGRVEHAEALEVAHDDDRLAVEARGRAGRVPDAHHEPRPPGEHHARDHRDRLRRGGALSDPEFSRFDV